MDTQIRRYQEIRAVLENLVADGPVGHLSGTYLAACSYLNRHCEHCGVQLASNDMTRGDALKQERSGVIDLAANAAVPICAVCLARYHHAGRA